VRFAILDDFGTTNSDHNKEKLVIQNIE